MVQTNTQTPTRRVSLVDNAYAQVKSRILNNELSPNTQVLEQDLAKELNMSRTPVREALIRLERDGLVEVLPRHGMRVLPLSVRDMQDIYEVLTVLESLAAQRLAERKPTTDELKPMLDAQADMDAALEKEDLVAWANADARFHKSLLELCGNERLSAIAMTAFDQAHRARMITLHMRPLPKQSNKDHHALLEAITNGNGTQASRIHRAHREKAVALFTEILDRFKLAAV